MVAAQRTISPNYEDGTYLRRGLLVLARLRNLTAARVSETTEQ